MSSLAAIAALGSIASAVGGGIMSAQANDASQEVLRAQRARERAEQNRLLMRGYVNSSENQSLLRRLQELQRESYNRARATNVVAGGTDAHLASMQQAGNKMVTDVAGNMAARADAWEDRVRQQGLASERAYSQQMFGLGQQKAQAIANAAGQATKAFAGIAAAGGTSDNPYEIGTTDATAPATTPTAATTPTITNPQIAAAVNDFDLQKALAVSPSLNGGKAPFTPAEYDAWMRTRENAQNIFGLIK